MYLDPGFGGMLLQLIIAVVAFGGAVIFAFRKKIKALFSKKDKKQADKPAIDANISETKAGTDDDVIDTLDE